MNNLLSTSFAPFGPDRAPGVFRPGDLVRVVRNGREYSRTAAFNDIWLPEMTLQIGHTLRVKSTGMTGVFLADGYSYPRQVLELVEACDE